MRLFPAAFCSHTLNSEPRCHKQRGGRVFAILSKIQTGNRHLTTLLRGFSFYCGVLQPIALTALRLCANKVLLSPGTQQDSSTRARPCLTSCRHGGRLHPEAQPRFVVLAAALVNPRGPSPMRGVLLSLHL